MAAADADVEYLDRPLVSEGFLEDRAYQTQLADAASKTHTLVCLPTGLGKTTVSCLVTAHRLAEYGGTSLMLAPTKPLVQQHADFYREALEVADDDIVVFTGDVRPDDRAELWESARIVMATPQVVENDLVGNRISLADVTHITFDECHRATGDYAYNYIAERYHADAEEPLVTGMSASPGGDEEEILTVCENLGLVEVEVMTDADADVEKHTYRTEVDWQHVDLPDDVLAIRDALNEVIRERLAKLKELGVTNSTDPNMSQRDLNKVRAQLQRLINNDDSSGYKGMSAHAEVMKLRRATELVETQSVESLRRYFERQREQARSSGASKASQRFVSEPKVKEAMRLAEEFDGLHPKFRKTRILLAETFGLEGGSRAIVFTESRDTAETLTEFLNESFDARRFVGQGDKEGSDGMTQTEQKETLDAFRAGEFEVLVSTSVAEEGLDVPDVDLVLFYEPVPKGVRSIQRKGRTGRASEGKVVVLIANDTRDEAFFWMAQNEEKQMEEELRSLKGMTSELESELSQESLGSFEESDGDSATTAKGATDDSDDDEGADAPVDDGEGDGQAGLDSFAGEREESEASAAEDEENDGVAAVAGTDESGVEIVADQRELDSTIARDLSKRDGIETRLETLAVGDYVLSDRVVVERKSVDDFLDTLLGEDRSMFEQVGDAVRNYARPVVIVEGENLYGKRNVHPNAIRGALASLAVDFGASVLFTEDEQGTANLLDVIARREQEESDREVRVHGEKSNKTLDEQQEYVVSSVAEVGPVTARALLESFGSVEAVMTAGEQELQEVEGVGPVTAQRVREVVGSEYAG
ncbi:DEAD/DEAH box helicase [Halosegnis rubeus]|jgi:Fanconi anemia group M protein|uniref:DEAD/DEAH box helicase n=1 Tax=Halosegnis rubeus TaxID=2212850 RepID=A0A5N5UCB9_9EURY|nr:DEAD/DEAH box helicase [Halosegnis rubeus]KAB7515252.1 DEAD/DEAH box helicase [Halosegnis rubeus]KAB7516306.1 DEAD/DEAH box helicase [Halosegnis rubeus]